MANTRTFQRAFSGGELTPEVWGHIENPKVQTGLATCRNFIVKPQGTAENRAGFAFVSETKDSTHKTRIISFTFSTTQTMVIEMGVGYFRFHTLGGTLLAGSPAAWNGATAYAVGDLVASGGLNYYCILAHTNQVPPNATYWYALPATGEYEIPSPYAEADLFDLHYVQSADVLTLTHPNYAPAELRRIGATNWQLVTPSFASPIAAPANFKAASNAKGEDYTYRYCVTAVAADGISESSMSAEAVGYSNYALTAATNANPGEFTFSGDLRTKFIVGSDVTFVSVGGMTEVNGNSYTIGTVVYSNTRGGVFGGSTQKTKITLKSGGVPVDTTAFGVYTTGGTMNVTFSGIKNNLFVTGAENNLGWDAVSGASRYNVYKFQGGLFGYIGQTTGLAFVDDNISPDLSKTPPVYDSVFGSTGNYPATVSYFEQRRVFAGTINKPQNIWMTKSGTESDMSYSLPIRDDDRIAFRVAAREANTIRHIVPLTQLMLLTSGAEWRVSSINSDAITPTTISVRPQSYVGASNVQPVIINNTLLYVAARGGHVREMAYNWQANGFITGDLSLYATHLFDTYDITDMAYAKAPYPIVWFVSSSGKLLGVTYVPEQQIGGWHWHDTDGTFESCAVVAEGGEDRLYVVVKRTINGVQKRYIERIASRLFSNPADAFFVDCGFTYSGAPATTISGLDAIEGKTVNILADGSVHPQRTVTSGAITLDFPASKVQVGLPITADLETVPIYTQIDASLGQGRAKNVNKAWLRVYRSSGVFVGPDANHLTQYKQRTTEPPGTPPALVSDEIAVLLTPSWAQTGQVFVRQSDPLPISVVSLTAEVALGG